MKPAQTFCVEAHQGKFMLCTVMARDVVTPIATLASEEAVRAYLGYPGDGETSGARPWFERDMNWAKHDSLKRRNNEYMRRLDVSSVLLSKAEEAEKRKDAILKNDQIRRERGPSYDVSYDGKVYTVRFYATMEPMEIVVITAKTARKGRHSIPDFFVWGNQSNSPLTPAMAGMINFAKSQLIEKT